MIIEKKYIVTCTKCGKQFKSHSPLIRVCKNCKSPKKNYPYKYKEARCDVQIRDKCVCTLCGDELSSSRVGFIDGNEKNINLDNLATLCNHCIRHISGNEAVISAKIKENNEELKKHQESEKNKKKPDLTNLHKLLNKLKR